MGLRTIIYVDAFNLYYGAVRKTPYRWLNLSALCRALLRSEDDLRAIKYFTALVQPHALDLGQRQRQETFLRALRTLPDVEIIFGHFLSHPVRMPLANYSGPGPRTVEVIKTEEKGSDVNLATHLLVDAFRDEFDLGIVISGDSDLAEPIRVVRQPPLSKKIGVWNPQRKPSIRLREVATFYKHLKENALRGCQFPDELEDRQGRFHKPPSW
ncbi:MAG: NYN domain-containing protein [Candidatus Omnitrophica bacterium]|nr:6-hydroxy-3-succinoylpyridine 3-monooxygenase HspA [bacterium]NUN95285.1 NYN domain-containing protein [Candidatus Omnitrophota bacterium]